MDTEREQYIPALRFDWLTPLYDPLLRWGMREEEFRRRLIEQARLEPGLRLRDVGTGTGTLPLLIKQAQPAVRVIGVDGDETVLAIARNKEARTGVTIRWHLGLAGALPYPDAIFDRVVTSLMLHHLTPSNKQRALREMWRVLRPGGELLIVDFGAPYNLVTRGLALVGRHLEETATHLEGRLPTMISEAGFTTVDQCDQWTTVVGPLWLWRAVKSGTEGVSNA